MLKPGAASLAAVLVAAVVVAGTTIAADPAAPIFRTDRVTDCDPDACGPGYAVAARSTIEGGSVLAVNVVVATGTGRDGMEAIAKGFRSRHEGSRVIVSFFSEEAGGERFAFGLVPSGDEPIEMPRDAPSWLATVDFGLETGATTRWWDP